MPWSIDILSLDGTTVEAADAPFKSGRVTWALDGSGALELNLRDSDAATGEWLYGRRRVALKDPADVRQFQGWLDHFERGGTDKLHPEYRAAVPGLAAILDFRAVHGDFSVVEEVATDAAMAILDHIAAQTDDQTGFTLGTVTGVARTVTRYFCDGDLASALIKELAETQDGGFAWEIGPNGELNAWVGGRGSDLSATVTLAPSDVIDWACIGDVSQMATYATGLGERDEQSSCGPPLVVDFTDERTEYGRREVVVESETSSEDDMQGITEEELRARVASRTTLRTTWIEGYGPWDFGDVWLGDVVNVELGPEFGGDADMRLLSVSMTFEPGVYEFTECEWEAA